MKKEELIYEISLTYSELVQYLLNKYGAAEYDYFFRIAQGELGSRNKKVSRTDEGLTCHHICEDRGGNLSSQFSAFFQPLEWQKKENLVYCNLLEHLLLHMKIAVLRQKEYRITDPNEIDSFFTTYGIYMICYQLNELFISEGDTNGWQKKCYPEIRENYNEYILLIQTLLIYIKNQCKEFNKDNRYIKKDSIIEFAEGTGKITGWSYLKDKVVFEWQDGSKRSISTAYLRQKLSFFDCWDQAARILCSRLNWSSGEQLFQKRIYKDVLTSQDELAQELAGKLSVDFCGYGFPMFASYLLDRTQFGSDNADEYIHKGLPSFVNSKQSTEITTKKPHFWIGSIPPEIKRSKLFYIVRIKTSFHHSSSNPPFVRYKEPDLFRSRSPFEFDENKNLLIDNGIILSDSSIIIHDEKIDWMKNSSGKKERVTVVLTLGRDDFELFKKEYKIISIRYLDGCYFE